METMPSNNLKVTDALTPAVEFYHPAALFSKNIPYPFQPDTNSISMNYLYERER